MNWHDMWEVFLQLVSKLFPQDESRHNRYLQILVHDVLAAVDQGLREYDSGLANTLMISELASCPKEDASYLWLVFKGKELTEWAISQTNEKPDTIHATKSLTDGRIVSTVIKWKVLAEDLIAWFRAARAQHQTQSEEAFGEQRFKAAEVMVDRTFPTGYNPEIVITVWIYEGYLREFKVDIR